MKSPINQGSMSNKLVVALLNRSRVKVCNLWGKK